MPDIIPLCKLAQSLAFHIRERKRYSKSKRLSNGHWGVARGVGSIGGGGGGGG